MFVILQKYDFSSKSQLADVRLTRQNWCLWYCKSTIFQANHNIDRKKPMLLLDVCDTAKVRFFKQITTTIEQLTREYRMFVILQKYDFSSKSQLLARKGAVESRCLWYCKSTIFQANHNTPHCLHHALADVCDTAKVRFFKQITTCKGYSQISYEMFVILQKYDFSSKSQQDWDSLSTDLWCLWYCKSTIFQANHNQSRKQCSQVLDVCDTAKVRFFKQITTIKTTNVNNLSMFVILQKYDFSSKSQLIVGTSCAFGRCLWYCKSTIFQANHNADICALLSCHDVCDTAKVRFFKQITTEYTPYQRLHQMFVILQKYDFSSKSQQ